MARALTWVASGLLIVALIVLALSPASWLALPLERITDGRLTLVDAAGTVWNGSAYVGGAATGHDPVTPLVAGRFSWRLSPMVLLGRVDARIENATALRNAVELTGSWTRWQVGPGALTLPADRLSGLGAPLNTIRPAGNVQVSWGPLELARAAGNLAVDGAVVLDIEDLSSRLSPIKPLGDYRLTIRCEGLEARLALETIRGPMLLSGSGGLVGGRWRFTGRAEASPEYEKDLANFLNLLGDSRREGDKHVVALQFQ